MFEHGKRLLLIVVAFALVVAALVVLSALGTLDGQVLAALLGALGVLTPAVIDASVEQRKRSQSIAPPAPAQPTDTDEDA